MGGFRRSGSRTLALAVVCVALAVPLIASAAPGDPDPGFGKRGTTLTQVDKTGSGAARVAVAPNGKLVAAGVGFDGLGEDTDADFAVVGYTARGKLDKGFGTDGANVFDFGEDYVWELPSDLAITADGKILVAGSTAVADFEAGAGIARLTADGRFDDSLAGDGTLNTNPEGLREASAVVPLADGDFLVTGPTGQSVAVARFNADGSLDPALAGDGVATHDLGNKARVGHAVLDGAGGIVVVVGSAAIGKDGYGLVRFGADGSFDAAFGDSGLATGDGSGVSELALAPGGKLVAAGERSVARFDAAGKPDASFAQGGTFTFSGPRRFLAEAVAVAPSGSIVLSGAGGRQVRHFAVARLKKGGKLDRRFGDDGYAIEDLGGQEAALGVALQDDGRIVAAGRARGRNLFIGGIGGRDTRFALARFLGR